MNFFFSSRRRHTFFFQAEDGIRDRSPSRGLGDVYKRQEQTQDELEVRLIAGHERCYRQISMLANIQFENRRLCHRFLLFFFGQIRGCISYNALRLKGGVVTYT